jgi:hypothetical protein
MRVQISEYSFQNLDATTSRREVPQ